MLDRSFRLLIALAIIATTAAFPLGAAAQEAEDLGLEVTAQASCEVVTFNIQVMDGAGDYQATFDFGDGSLGAMESFSGSTLVYEYTYPTPDTYQWIVEVTDTSTEASGLATGTVQVGPQVTMNSDPFPPVLTLEGGSATAEFSAEVTGENVPFAYQWDLDGDGTVDDDASSTTSFEYTEAGKYTATVEVTDECGLPASDSLPVVVFDPEDACHPMAQRIGEAVSGLFPDQSEDTYACEDIFGFFNGDLTGDQLGFGRMWHAYQLAESLEELTWEEILDWHLNQGGWGLLTQLDRYSEALTEIGLRDLTQMIMEGEATINEVRTAVRSVVRFEADFEDALTRLQDGASPGELGQFYRLASDLELDPTALDAYLDEGMSLPEIKHLGSLAERFEADMDELALARQDGASWGDMNQAYRLADDETSAAEILAMGVKQYRESMRDQAQQDREQDRLQRTLDRLAEQYGSDALDQALLDCDEGDLSCLRDNLRQQAQQDRQAERDERTAQRLVDQYGSDIGTVMGLFSGVCAGDWSCVRAELRGSNQPGNGNNKNK